MPRPLLCHQVASSASKHSQFLPPINCKAHLEDLLDRVLRRVLINLLLRRVWTVHPVKGVPVRRVHLQQAAAPATDL